MTHETKTTGRVAVIGASEGLGRGVAQALADGGWSVLAIARTEATLATLSHAAIETRVGDATDEALARSLLPNLDAFVLVAGARPVMAPLAEYEWEDLQRPFEVDVKATFVWLKAALSAPSRPRHAIVFSSGAALHGSPLSGGYAGAKHTQRFLCQYARGEAAQRELPLTVQCVLPQLNPSTALGRAGIAAYAQQAGETAEAFAAKRFGTPLDGPSAGAGIAAMLAGEYGAPEYVLLGTGPKELG